ncbi:dihydrolipoamide acetyltransferase family protein [Streptomyces sp. DSM 42041]|uniref:Dihydrolipoamide acetyltransferase component of pyruvate dehydrogenase complex n=1 Tax=Streptomyces hazeniae TaxID=3075538 RepID=A0ABU2NPX5_9ACTN|nr:dihydrolipoamide acetyltransferase family protein [Streptomyces sp. DSM 42041]MDT0379029.1 dihydrolipoamide acetyltransferase family protein [Streptomyces sp. DSM 42041]
MAEIREFALPDLGEGLTEATITTWMVEVGEVVAVDQPVVEVETAKAMVEVPCPYGGVVTARYGGEGDEMPVGAPLVAVAVGATSSEEAGAAAAPAGDAAPDDTDEGSGNVLVGYGTQAPSARRRRRVGGGVGHVAAPAPAPAPAATGTTTSGASRRGVGGEATGGSRPQGVGPRGESGATAAVRGHERGVVAEPDRPGNDRPGPDRPGNDRPGPDRPGNDNAGARNGDASGRPEGAVAVISPLVRRIARESGIDLRDVTGSGPDGLIMRGDVERAAERGGAAGDSAVAGEEAWEAAPAAPARTPSPAGAASRIPLRGLRGTVADKLSRSRREIPDATTWVDADATELLAARRAMNAAGGPKISLLALLARISTAALARFPELNSTVDLEAREIVRLDAVHLGFAAQTDRGLVVPVVRDAHTLDAEGIAAEIARLTESARAGTLSPAELTGGTFTLNNYGVFGVDGSTPIINHPEAAMLGVGRIVDKPWAVNGELAVRKVVQLSFTFDHRVCDGGTAGGFLRYVADCVEQPAVLLRTL